MCSIVKFVVRNASNSKQSMSWLIFLFFSHSNQNNIKQYSTMVKHESIYSRPVSRSKLSAINKENKASSTLHYMLSLLSSKQANLDEKLKCQECWQNWWSCKWGRRQGMNSVFQYATKKIYYFTFACQYQCFPILLMVSFAVSPCCTTILVH